MRQPTKARRIDAKSPAEVPSALTAPSVPLGTIFNVVTRYLPPSTSFKYSGLDFAIENKERTSNKNRNRSIVINEILFLKYVGFVLIEEYKKLGAYLSYTDQVEYLQTRHVTSCTRINNPKLQIMDLLT